MTSLVDWEQQNEVYLSAALSRLRSQFDHFIQTHSPEPKPYEDAQPLQQAQTHTQPQQTIEQSTALMESLEASTTPPALVYLTRAFGLSRFEQDLLLLCAAMELDPSHTASSCQQIYPYQPYPTFALALQLFENPTWDALTPERPLRHWQLIEINQPGAQPLVTSTLRADERVVSYVKGLNYLDDRVAPLVIPSESFTDTPVLAASQQALVETIVHSLKSNSSQSHREKFHAPVVQLVGSDRQSQERVARQAARTLGLHLYLLPLDHLPSQISELETFARLWHRESILLPIVLFIDMQFGGQQEPHYRQLLQRFSLRCRCLLFLGLAEAWQQLTHTLLTFDVRKPTLQEQQTAWHCVVGDLAPDTPSRLVSQFNLNLPEINHIGQAVFQSEDYLSGDLSGDTESEDKIVGDLGDRLWHACLIQTRPQLNTLAQRIEAKATWDDIVLPDKAMNLLRQLTDQVRYRSQVYQDWGFHRRMNRGFGISALFAGDSGTGKTMAAEVVANALKLDLYHIDLSSVVNKYIGETEKKLCQLFDAAEDSGAILFFDEADALFGKRSEVRDSHDRYANIEVNYLLQRMESYRGLAILATNFRSSLDHAFLRRLRFLIDFPFPGIVERQKIWQKAFPPETPLDNLNYQHLARFNLTGGSVHNIVLNATFVAAAADAALTMRIVLDAIRTEFEKLERPINNLEFHENVALRNI